MRKVFRVSVLLLALSCPIYAGEIGFGAPAPPPPSPSQSMSVAQGELPALGEIHTVEADSLADTVLSVMESVLALLY